MADVALGTMPGPVALLLSPVGSPPGLSAVDGAPVALPESTDAPPAELDLGGELPPLLDNVSDAPFAAALAVAGFVPSALQARAPVAPGPTGRQPIPSLSWAAHAPGLGTSPRNGFASPKALASPPPSPAPGSVTVRMLNPSAQAPAALPALAPKATLTPMVKTSTISTLSSTPWLSTPEANVPPPAPSPPAPTLLTPPATPQPAPTLPGAVPADRPALSDGQTLPEAKPQVARPSSTHVARPAPQPAAAAATMKLVPRPGAMRRSLLPAAGARSAPSASAKPAQASTFSATPWLNGGGDAEAPPSLRVAAALAANVSDRAGGLPQAAGPVLAGDTSVVVDSPTARPSSSTLPIAKAMTAPTVEQRGVRAFVVPAPVPTRLEVKVRDGDQHLRISVHREADGYAVELRAPRDVVSQLQAMEPEIDNALRHDDSGGLASFDAQAEDASSWDDASSDSPADELPSDAPDELPTATLDGAGGLLNRRV